jgi:pimeloyl-ACP methyl ester carboxylesterase
MLAWYRAALRRPPPRLESLEVTVPVQVIWGTRDRFLGQEMVAPSLAYCPHGRLELLPDATHWVQHEEPERVNRLLVDLFMSL